MPVCENCNDTHKVTFEHGTRGWVTWMCTRCPVPCQKCRAGGHGPFCESTPCDCDCHGHAQKFPLHQKARKHQAEMMRFGEFLEFMERTGRLNYVDNTQAKMNFENIIGEFFEIDPKAFSKEKDAMADLAQHGYTVSEQRRKANG